MMSVVKMITTMMMLILIFQVSGTLLNTGHEIKLVLDESGSHTVRIAQGPYTYAYLVREIILHFGSDDTLGSEHTIDEVAFPAEVTFCTSYKNHCFCQYKIQVRVS